MASVATGMAIIDLQGRWVEVNPVLARLLGQDAQSLRGQPVADSFHPDDAQHAHECLSALAQQSSANPVLPQRYRKPGGDIFQARAEIAVMRGDDDKPCYLVMHLHEPELQPRGEQAMREALAESQDNVRALIRQQEIFAHGISHDLRAPLRVIESFSQLLDSHSAATLDETSRDYLQRIRAAAMRMGGLIDALLDLSRVERTELTPEPVDVSLLAEWVAAELQDAEPGRDVDIQVAPDLHVLGNERLLRMLLQQLLGNAWRFSAPNAPVRIRVEGTTAQGRVQVAVRDEGRGFDMRYADKIFEPFQRLHASEQGGGAGIGLAIARRIVERHGGRICARSEVGAGSVFTFELPAADADSRANHFSLPAAAQNPPQATGPQA